MDERVAYFTMQWWVSRFCENWRFLTWNIMCFAMPILTHIRMGSEPTPPPPPPSTGSVSCIIDIFSYCTQRHFNSLCMIYTTTNKFIILPNRFYDPFVTGYGVKIPFPRSLIGEFWGGGIGQHLNPNHNSLLLPPPILTLKIKIHAIQKLLKNIINFSSYKNNPSHPPFYNFTIQ